MKKIFVSVCFTSFLIFGVFAQEDVTNEAKHARRATYAENAKHADNADNAKHADEATDLKVEADGSVELTWGIDLGSGTNKKFGEPAYPTHGFYNETDIGIYIPFLGEKHSFTGGSDKEANVYSEVKFNVWPGDMFIHSHELDEEETKKAGYTDWADGADVSGKLVFYGAYLKVYNKPNFSANYAIGWKPIRTHRWNINRRGGEKWFGPGFKGWGGKIGYANEDILGLDTGLKFGSNRTWMREDDKFADGKERPEKTVDSLYAIGFDFHMEPVEKFLTIDATVNSTFHAPKYYKAGIKPENLGGKDGKTPVTNFGMKIGSEPVDKLKIGLGFDGVTGLTYDGNKETFGWDLGFTVAYNWVDFGLYVCGTGTDKHGTDFTKNTPANCPNMALHLGFNSEEVCDTNLVPGLGLHFTVNAYDLLSKRSEELKKQKLTVPLGLNFGASYKAGITDSMWIRPFFDLYGETNHNGYEDDTKESEKKRYFGLAYEIGVTFSPVEKAEITAKWAHGRLNDNKYEGFSSWDPEDAMISAPVNHKCHNGTFTLGCELKF